MDHAILLGLDKYAESTHCQSVMNSGEDQKYSKNERKKGMILPEGAA